MLQRSLFSLRAQHGIGLSTAGALRSSSSSTVDLAKYKGFNEPFLNFAPKSEERHQLEEALKRWQSKVNEVPVVVGDREFTDQNGLKSKLQPLPHKHKTAIAKFYCASEEVIGQAIEVAMAARVAWEARPLEERCAIFLRAAELASTKYKMDLCATTMLGQGKTAYQAVIDAGAELIDFLRYNVQFALDAARYRPLSTATSNNHLELRGTEGFWAALTPFNFTAIGSNLSSTPALMGNVVLWKPAGSAILSNYVFFKIMLEAGVPPGVINFVPSEGSVYGKVITRSPHFAGLNFTGSTNTFRTIWKMMSDQIDVYRCYPRMIGECGGKNFHLIHPSIIEDAAAFESAVIGTLRSAFEYSGQKCSACSRLYLPKSIADRFKQRLLELREKLVVGSPTDIGRTFTSAVIDRPAFDKIQSYIKYAKDSYPKVTLLAGGKCDASKGFFIEPTVVEVGDPKDRLMREEIFGPLLSLYVYDDADWESTLRLIDETNEYALTGAIYARDEEAILQAKRTLRQTMGNLYLNDQSTGAMVNQQPFGGARLSGTNDKAGGPHYVLRFVSPLAVKRTLTHQRSYLLPHHDAFHQ